MAFWHLVVANPLMNGFLLLFVGAPYMHSRCVDSNQHCNLKND